MRQIALVGRSVGRSVGLMTRPARTRPTQIRRNKKKKGQRLAEKNGSFGREDERREEEKLDRKEGRWEMGKRRRARRWKIVNADQAPRSAIESLVAQRQTMGQKRQHSIVHHQSRIIQRRSDQQRGKAKSRSRRETVTRLWKTKRQVTDRIDQK